MLDEYCKQSKANLTQKLVDFCKDSKDSLAKAMLFMGPNTVDIGNLRIGQYMKRSKKVLAAETVGSVESGLQMMKNIKMTEVKSAWMSKSQKKKLRAKKKMTYHQIHSTSTTLGLWISLPSSFWNIIT